MTSTSTTSRILLFGSVSRPPTLAPCRAHRASKKPVAGKPWRPAKTTPDVWFVRRALCPLVLWVASSASAACEVAAYQAAKFVETQAQRKVGVFLLFDTRARGVLVLVPVTVTAAPVRSPRRLARLQHAFLKARNRGLTYCSSSCSYHVNHSWVCSVSEHAARPVG